MLKCKFDQLMQLYDIQLGQLDMISPNDCPNSILTQSKFSQLDHIVKNTTYHHHNDDCRHDCQKIGEIDLSIINDISY